MQGSQHQRGRYPCGGWGLEKPDSPFCVRNNVDGGLGRVRRDEAGNGIVFINVVGEVLDKVLKLERIDRGRSVDFPKLANDQILVQKRAMYM